MALETVGLGAIISADTKPLVKGLKPGKQALNEFSKGVAKVEPPVKSLGKTVTNTAAQVQAGANKTKQAAKTYTDSNGRLRDANGRFVAGAKKVPPALDKITRSSNRTSKSMKGLAQNVATGASKINRGFQGVAMGMAPMTLAIAVGAKKAASFEKQMGAVGAVSRANAKDMSALTAEAKRMGIVSAFSATQSGEGMEFMARAGAKPKEIISGLSGVMNAAAADGIELAQSSDVVARVVKGMGLEWKDASHIADTLALASSSSNTNILALGESFVYGSSTARQLGLPLEEVTSLFGKMADAGLRGSLGGTAFANMMVKLTKPSKKGEAILKKFNVRLTKTDGSMRKIADIVEQFNTSLQKVPSVADRNAMAMEVFGLRGARAFSALAAAGAQSTKELEKQLIESSKGVGAAQEMAEKRLDNLIGRMTLLMSSAEGLAIGVFGPLFPRMSRGVKGFTDSLNTVLMALEDINAIMDESGGDAEKMAKAQSKYGKTVWAIATGIRSAVDTIGDAWDWMVGKIKVARKWITDTFGENVLSKITKFATLIVLGGAVLAPLILGAMTLGWVISGLASIASGVFTVIAAVIKPVLIIVGALYLAYQLIRKENETFYDTARRVWGGIKSWALDAWENGLKPFIDSVMNVLGPSLDWMGTQWSELFQQIKYDMLEAYDILFGGSEIVKSDWEEIGNQVGIIVKFIATSITWLSKNVIGPVFGHAVKVVAWMAKQWFTLWGGVLEWVGRKIEMFGAAYTNIMDGQILKGLQKIGAAMLDNLLTPLRIVLKGAIKVADALGEALPKGIKDFANEGLAEMSKMAGPKASRIAKDFSKGLRQYADKGLETTLGYRLERVKSEKKKDSLFPIEKLVDDKGNLTAPALAEAPSLATKTTEMSIEKKRLEAENSKEKWEQIKNAVKDGAKEGTSKADLKADLAIDNKMCVDSETIATAQSRHQMELNERSAFKNTPWQRRAAAEHGAIVVPG